MESFERKNALFSLCGLNCGLCSMRLGGYCAGCGLGNKPCKIARCAAVRPGVEYCFQCENYPCDKYDNIDIYDSFITHRNQKADMQKAKECGIEAYNAEQTEKMMLLNKLLTEYNDGRKKTLYCLAVNLLEPAVISAAIASADDCFKPQTAPVKEKADYLAGLLNTLAAEKNTQLKLRKKPTK